MPAADLGARRVVDVALRKVDRARPAHLHALRRQPEILVLRHAVGGPPGELAEPRLVVRRGAQVGETRLLDAAHDLADIDAREGAVGHRKARFALESRNDLPLEAPCPASASVMLLRPSSQSNSSAPFSSGSAATPSSTRFAPTTGTSPEPSSVTSPRPRPPWSSKFSSVIRATFLRSTTARVPGPDRKVLEEMRSADTDRSASARASSARSMGSSLQSPSRLPGARACRRGCDLSSSSRTRGAGWRGDAGPHRGPALARLSGGRGRDR